MNPGGHDDQCGPGTNKPKPDILPPDKQGTGGKDNHTAIDRKDQDSDEGGLWRNSIKRSNMAKHAAQRRDEKVRDFL